MTDGRVMAAGAESRPLESQEKTEWGKGWKIVAVAFAAYVVGSTAMFFTFGLFLGSLTAEFHSSRQAISGSLAISGVVFAIASPVTGVRTSMSPAVQLSRGTPRVSSSNAVSSLGDRRESFIPFSNSPAK